MRPPFKTNNSLKQRRGDKDTLSIASRALLAPYTAQSRKHPLNSSNHIISYISPQSMNNYIFIQKKRQQRNNLCCLLGEYKDQCKSNINRQLFLGALI